MIPSQLRAKLKEWLSQQLRIDRWGLNSPESIRDLRAPPSSGLDGNTSGYSIVEVTGTGETSSYLLQTEIPIQIEYRFDNSYSYTEIPRSEAEDALVYILLYLQAHQSCLSPDIQSIESMGNVLLNEEKKSDWLLSFVFQFNVKFHCEFAELTAVSGVFTA
jgi:hypothetical protein